MNDPTHDLDELRKAYRENPHDRDAATSLALHYCDRGWFNEADEIYKDLLKRYPDDYAVLLDYGNLCFRRRSLDEAERAFRRLTQLKPSRLEGWNNLGIVLLTRGNEEAAKDSFTKVLELEPDNCGALLNMGNYFDRKGDTARAIEMFEKAVEARRDFADGWFDLGNAYIKARQYDKAIEGFRRALRIQPEFPSALKNLGFAYEQLNNFEEAEESYNKALELNKTDATLYVNLATIYAKQRRYDRAKDYYLRAVKLSPREAAGWMGLRHLSLLKGDIPTYVKSTLAVLHRLDASVVADSLHRLRDLRFWEGTDAIITLADKLGLSDDSLDAERLLEYQRTGREQGKVNALYRKLSNAPGITSTICECLARFDYNQGKFERVINRLETSARHELRTLKLLWMALLEVGRHADAAASVEAFLKDHSDCFDAWFLLARARSALGDRSETKRCLVRALENGFTDFDELEKDAKLQSVYEDLALGKD